jgi:hypothetical protein
LPPPIGRERRRAVSDDDATRALVREPFLDLTGTGGDRVALRAHRVNHPVR